MPNEPRERVSIWGESEIGKPDFNVGGLQRQHRVNSRGVIPSSVQSLQTGNISGISQSVIVAPPGAKEFGNFNSILAAIEFIKKKGGGIVFIKNGTYREKENIIVPSGVSLIGESVGGVVILFSANDASIKVQGTDVYETGTVSITKGTTTLTGTSTVWLTNITTDHKFKIGKFIYRVKSIDSDTQVTLKDRFSDTTASGASYTAAKFKDNILLQNLVIAAPLVNGLVMSHVDGFFVQNLIVSQAITNSGIIVTDCIRGGFNFITSSNCGGSGLVLEGARQINYSFVVCENNGNTGITANDITHSEFEFPTLVNNASNGMTITSSNRFTIRTPDISGNGNNGVELLSDNSYVQMSTGALENNGADGLKLTATTDNCIINGIISTGNGDDGVEIAAATCDDNIVVNSQLAGNTGTSLVDNGTGTTAANNET